MRTNILCLAFAANLAFETLAQRTRTTTRSDDQDDSVSSVTTTSTPKSEDPRTCGYINGDPDDAFTCSSSCAFLDVSGRDNRYLGCCRDGQCYIPTTCIESGTASGRLTLACTKGSSSRCQTWSWPDLSAEAYGCATSRATLTVATEATTDVVSAAGGGFGSSTTTMASGQPTKDVSDPDIRWEYGLNSRQRLGAGIGSGVTGGLLLIFFGIFGCWRGPRRREPQPGTQRQDTDQSETRRPGEKPAMKRTVSGSVTTEETQASASSWTASTVDIESPQPRRPRTSP